MSALRQILPAEPPVNPQTRLLEAARTFYAQQVPPLSPSELIDMLTHETDPAERQAIATRIGRTAP